MTGAENSSHNLRVGAEIAGRYLYHDPEWPKFRWNSEALLGLLAKVRHQQGKLFGQMHVLGFDLRQQIVLKTLTQDVVKTSEIEGESLDAEQVRSSIARRLGVHIAGLKPVDRTVEGIVEVMLFGVRIRRGDTAGTARHRRNALGHQQRIPLSAIKTPSRPNAMIRKLVFASVNVG